MERLIPVRKLTQDTFQNFAARTGIGAGNITSGNTYGFNPISRVRTLIEWMYRGSWLCGNAVDCVADDMTREGVDLSTTMKPDEVERMNGALRRLQIWQSLNNVAKWARLYGGALGYIGVEGQDPATPLRLETIKKGQFQGITVVDRWMVNPDLTHSISEPGPDFGNPEFYNIVATSFSFPFPRFRIHWSRCVRMEGISLPYWQKVAENMWGISVLERIYDRLTAFDSTTAGASQLAYRSYLRTLSVENLRSLIANGGKSYEALVAQIELIRKYQANEGITLLDAKDKFETHAYTFAGLADLLNSFGEQISGATQIPMVRLFGQTPGGLSNGDDEHALRTYYDNILRLQERWFRRPLDIILRVVAAHEGIAIPDGFEYEFKSLWQTTDREKSDINLNDTNAAGTAMDMGLPKALILRELRQSGRRTGYWTNITDEMIADAEKEDAEAPSAKNLLSMTRRKPIEGHEEEVDFEGGGTGDQARILDWNGLPLHIEVAKGEVRRGGDGVESWQVTMPADYGFITGVPSAEGPLEELDVFLGPAEDSDTVFVLNQRDLVTLDFDEHKVLLGFQSWPQAKAIYEASYSDGLGAERIMSYRQYALDEFKAWLQGGFDRHKPV